LPSWFSISASKHLSVQEQLSWQQCFEALQKFATCDLSEIENDVRYTLDSTEQDEVTQSQFSMFVSWFGPFTPQCFFRVEAVLGAFRDVMSKR